MPDLFTPKELENYLGKGKGKRNTVAVTEFQKGADYAKNIIHNYCKREFVQTTYTSERVTNRPAKKLHEVLHKKVKSITSIVTGFLDSNATTETIESQFYEVRATGFELTFIPSADFFSVTYVAGESSTPEDIKEVALGLAKRVLVPEDRPAGSVSSMSAGGVNYQFLTADFKKRRPTANDYWDSILNSYIRGRHSVS